MYETYIILGGKPIGLHHKGVGNYGSVNLIRLSFSYSVLTHTGKFTIYVGNEEQSRYQDYWFMKGFLEEPAPNPQNLMEYVNYSGYDEILFLIVKDPVVDTRKIGLFGSLEEKRVSVEIKGFLIGKDKLLGSYSSTNEDDSKRSELRARQGAFKKSIRDIYSGLQEKF